MADVDEFAISVPALPLTSAQFTGRFEVNVMLCPAVPTVADGVITRPPLFSGAAPVPVSAMVCGELSWLSFRSSVAVSVPVVDGVNVIVMLQLAPEATIEPHVLAALKSAAFVPAVCIDEIVNSAGPRLVSVTNCMPLVVPMFWLPKVTVEALSDTCGCAWLPAPPPIIVQTLAEVHA